MTERDQTSLATLPARAQDSHKGTFGTVGVFGGREDDQACMLGAPALVARAALRTGCGLVRMVMAGRLLARAIQIEPSATGIPVEVDEQGRTLPHAMTARVDEAARDSDCLVVGPGLGMDAGARAAVLRAVQQEETPVVLDADAIGIIASIEELHRELRGRLILTPHPGEYRRLASSLRLTESLDGDGERVEAAAGLARRLGCVVVLKGSQSVVSDGLRAWTCERGGPSLATAGTGDVLCGVIAGLLAQHGQPAPLEGLSDAMRERMARDPERPLDLYDAARLAVELHARAGEAWTAQAHAEGGMLARELCDRLPALVQSVRG